MKVAHGLRAFQRAIGHWSWREYGLLFVFWAITVVVPYVHGWGLLSFFVLPIAVASGFLLTYAILRLLPRAPAVDPANRHAIEVYTVIGDEERHAKATHVDGTGRLMWVVTGDESRSIDAPLTSEAFRALWDSLRSIGDLEDYKTHASVETFDLASNYFVGMGFTDQGVTYVGKYLIPHGCTSRPLTAWLDGFMATRHASA